MKPFFFVFLCRAEIFFVFFVFVPGGNREWWAAPPGAAHRSYNPGMYVSCIHLCRPMYVGMYVYNYIYIYMNRPICMNDIKYRSIPLPHIFSRKKRGLQLNYHFVFWSIYYVALPHNSSQSQNCITNITSLTHTTD